MMSDTFCYISPASELRPILVSIPHCGSKIPLHISRQLRPALATNPDDTDHHLDRLYGFCAEHGIGVLHSVYCRYVVDLNRPRDNEKLYADGRQITGLIPTRSFATERLYIGAEPNAADVENRLLRYYDPYHAQLLRLLTELRAKFDNVLLWEAHSIRRQVPSISSAPFVDLMLGDNNHRSADPGLTTLAVDTLSGDYQVGLNHPFRGGHITRHYATPDQGLHAIQLEMSKDIYLDDAEINYAPNRAACLATRIQSTLIALADRLEAL